MVNYSGHLADLKNALRITLDKKHKKIKYIMKAIMNEHIHLFIFFKSSMTAPAGYHLEKISRICLSSLNMF